MYTPLLHPYYTPTTCYTYTHTHTRAHARAHSPTLHELPHTAYLLPV